jgi:hypothetical protein
MAPQPRHAHRRPQFPRPRLLLTYNREHTLKASFRFPRIRPDQINRNSPGNAIYVGFAQFFFGRFNCRHRSANAAQSIIELAAPYAPSQNLINAMAETLLLLIIVMWKLGGDHLDYF